MRITQFRQKFRKKTNNSEFLVYTNTTTKYISEEKIYYDYLYTSN